MTSCFVYKVIRGLESIDHLCINPIHRIGLIHKYSINSGSSSEAYKLMFYFKIVNKILRHCRPWLARQYLGQDKQNISWLRNKKIKI